MQQCLAARTSKQQAVSLRSHIADAACGGDQAHQAALLLLLLLPLLLRFGPLLLQWLLLSFMPLRQLLRLLLLLVLAWPWLPLRWALQLCRDAAACRARH